MKKTLWAMLLLSITLLSSEIDKAWQAIVKQDYQTALKILNPIVKHNSSTKKESRTTVGAKGLLGYMYYNGLGVNKDILKAEKLLKTAAKGEAPLVNYTLGTLYEEAFGVVSDPMANLKDNPYEHIKGYQGSPDYFYKAAIENFKVATSKIPLAYAELGYLYYTGVIFLNIPMVAPDYKKAKYNLSKAIESKDPSSAARAGEIFGLMYLNGNGVLQDFSEAKKYFNLAIKNGNTNAKCNLGALLLKQNKIAEAKRIIKEGYNDGNEYCGQLWNQNNLGQ